MKLIEADSKASNNLVELKKVKKIKQKVNEFLKEKLPVPLKDLVINGKDLINLGYKENKKLGEALNNFLGIVIEKPELNRKKILLKLAEGEERGINK